MAAFSSGVLHGQAAWDLLQHAKHRQAALPAVNVTGSSTINATLEAARRARSAVIIQLSYGGAVFYAGKGMAGEETHRAVTGAVAAAQHVHAVAKDYGVPVILHTDHADKARLPWVEGLLGRGQTYFEREGRPLFSSHMLDLSEETLEENIATSLAFFERIARLEMCLEIELGITGGEEDGVDNTAAAAERLYTQPEDVASAYRVLGQVSPHFLIAASFGNVHGVYAPENVKLQPSILKSSQTLVQERFHTGHNPVSFVFHGGSGTPRAQIQEALSYGVVKMNIDTDLQWAFWDGVRAYEAENRDFLQAQLGNPTGSAAPNKKYYDPRAWLRSGERAFADRLAQAFEALNAVDLNA